MESLGQQEEIYHFSHKHPLELTEIKHDDEILCSACTKRCSGQIYVCSFNCKFFLHDSCFSLPRNVHHRFHPHHNLTLISHIQHTFGPRCFVCRCRSSGFTYSCDYCQINMHVECPVMISTIKYEGHGHNILFLDNLLPSRPCILTDMDYLCGACGNHCESSQACFHCAECDFNLHLQCGPLPCFIEDKENHPCRLKLTDSPVMVDGGDKGGDWFICDVCEEERDPRLPVYYCSDGCAYIAEIKCVISAVQLSLSGEYGEVELRSAIWKHKGGKVIFKSIVTEIQPSWEDSECLYFNDIKDRDQEEFVVPNMIMQHFAIPSYSEKYYINGTDEEVFSGSNEDYTKFIALIDTMDCTKILHEFLKNYGDHRYTNILASLQGNNGGEHIIREAILHPNRNNLVNVGNHSVCAELAPILEDLCTKYEDIIPQSAPSNMNLSIMSLCITMRGMCTTRVVDISAAKFFSWLRCLKGLQSQGFKVEFALDRLKIVADAFYAFEVQKKVKEDSNQIDRKIQEVSQCIKEQEAELRELKERRKRSEQQKDRELQEADSSSSIAECFKKAVELKWKIVGEGLL